MIRLLRIPLLHVSHCSRSWDNDEECMCSEEKVEGGNKHYLIIKKQLLFAMCHNKAARIRIFTRSTSEHKPCTICRSKHSFSQKIWEGKRRGRTSQSPLANCDTVTQTSNEHSRKSLCVSVEISSVPLSNCKALPTPCCSASFKVAQQERISFMNYSHNW